MIPLFKVVMSDLAKSNVAKVLDSGYIGEGTQVKQFEQELSDYIGLPVLTVNSATSAIDLVMHMLNIGEGDEIITTPITCTATNSPGFNRGATLVWCDVNPQTGLIDPNDVARKITSKTKCIIAVNWGGLSPDYEKLKSFGIPVLEDAAHGGYRSNKARGDYIVWSTQAIKHLTTGDGGFMHTPDNTRARLLRWYGLDRESKADFRCSQNIVEVGYKYHMNDIAASIGLANLTMLPYLLKIHNDNARYYDFKITNPKIVKPLWSEDHPFWLYTILVENRDAFIKYLEVKGIGSSQVHARNDKHSGFNRTRYAFENQGVTFFDTHQVSIPVGSWLLDTDLDHIVNAVNGWQ